MSIARMDTTPIHVPEAIIDHQISVIVAITMIAAILAGNDASWQAQKR